MLASCSGGGDGGRASNTTQPATTTHDRTPYTGEGPYAAGVTDLALVDGRRVVVWYPADKAAADATPRQTFDIASLLSPELQAKIPAEMRVQYEIDAHPGAASADDDGAFPLVLFSHGFAGFPEQSAHLTTFLARWGFVVVAPDHVERSLSGLLGTAARGVARRRDREVLGLALDAVVAEGRRRGSHLAGIVDEDRAAVIGHSAGAGAAYEMASRDGRIDAFISYSLAEPAGADAPEPPDVPGMVMLGTADGVIPAASTRAAYEHMRGPKYRVELARAGHLVFSDICLIGREQGGLIGIARSIDLPIPSELAKLGTDGCTPEDLDPRRAFPVIDDVSVAFLRRYLGIDDDDTALDPEALAGGFPGVRVMVRAQR